jgi:hypothetical protein
LEKILFTVIEANDNNINNNNSSISKVTTPRLYEDEAILCFEEWRKNAGELKDIKIICYCPTHNVPSSETIRKLKDLNVTYIENYLPESENMEIGFFLVPLVGKIIENEYPDAYLIHIDLDMKLIKPIPDYLFENTADIYCGQYDKYAVKDQRKLTNINPKWIYPLDTGFTVSHNSTKFYEYYWDRFINLYKNDNYKKDEGWNLLNTGVYHLEEYVMDVIFYNNELNVKPINYYQIGEGYTKVNLFPDDKIKDILFWHEHIFLESDYKHEKTREKINFFKRLKGLENARI